MKDNFDDILKRKWEEQHFPVDESHRAGNDRAPQRE